MTPHRFSQDPIELAPRGAQTESEGPSVPFRLTEAKLCREPIGDCHYFGRLNLKARGGRVLQVASGPTGPVKRQHLQIWLVHFGLLRLEIQRFVRSEWYPRACACHIMVVERGPTAQQARQRKLGFGERPWNLFCQGSR